MHRLFPLTGNRRQAHKDYAVRRRLRLETKTEVRLFMNMTNQEYVAYVENARRNRRSEKILSGHFWREAHLYDRAALIALYMGAGLAKEEAGTATSLTLVFLSALLRPRALRQAGQARRAGTLVPITGFANAMVSPALEFRSEGFVMWHERQAFYHRGAAFWSSASRRASCTVSYCSSFSLMACTCGRNGL
jgi:stage V sporulation protein AC